MSGTLPIQIFSKAAALDRGTICTIKTIYFMNISSYLSHIKCFVKDCPPRVCPVSVKQLARIFKIEYFSRNSILYRIMMCPIAALYSMGFMLLIPQRV